MPSPLGFTLALSPLPFQGVAMVSGDSASPSKLERSSKLGNENWRLLHYLREYVLKISLPSGEISENFSMNFFFAGALQKSHFSNFPPKML